MFLRRKKSYAAVVSLLSVVNVLAVKNKFALSDDATNSINMSVTPDEVKLNSGTDDTKTKHTKKVNPFDCINPACSSKMDMLQMAMKQRNNVQIKNEEVVSPPSTIQDQNSTSDNDLTIDLIEETTIYYPTSSVVSDCPLDREELGRSTWDLIHTTAAYFPDTPTEEDKENARNFIISLAYLYPCEVCREDFKESVAKLPPQVNSRAEFSIWCCKLHNEVNEKLGYENKYNSCDLAALDERWKVGRKACWDADD